jgi:hypothetical protein
MTTNDELQASLSGKRLTIACSPNAITIYGICYRTSADFITTLLIKGI